MIHTYIPTSSLSQFVDIIWTAHHSFVTVKETSHPFLQTELIFHYGDCFSVKGHNVLPSKSEEATIILSGVKCRPFITEVGGRYSAVGLFLKPHCFGLIKEESWSKLTAISNSLYELLIKESEPDFYCAEKVLKNLFSNHLPIHYLLSFQQRVGSRHLQKGSLGEELRTMKISKKHFIQQFKRYIGLMPGEFVKLKQVNAAIDLMKKRQGLSLSEIGHRVGFYDQSHFTRIFKTYCGKTPTKFQKQLGR